MQSSRASSSWLDHSRTAERSPAAAPPAPPTVLRPGGCWGGGCRRRSSGSRAPDADSRPRSPLSVLRSLRGASRSQRRREEQGPESIKGRAGGKKKKKKRTKERKKLLNSTQQVAARVGRDLAMVTCLKPPSVTHCSLWRVSPGISLALHSQGKREPVPSLGRPAQSAIRHYLLISLRSLKLRELLTPEYCGRRRDLREAGGACWSFAASGGAVTPEGTVRSRKSPGHSPQPLSSAPSLSSHSVCTCRGPSCWGVGGRKGDQMTLLHPDPCLAARKAHLGRTLERLTLLLRGPRPQRAQLFGAMSPLGRQGLAENLGSESGHWEELGWRELGCGQGGRG